MKGKITQKRKLGNLGEKICTEYLEKKGFSLVVTNYQKKWGEIDVIVRKGNKLHFVEVKSVSCESLEGIDKQRDSYRPEDNMHPWKLQRLSRAIRTYLLEHDSDEEGDWQFDVATVYIDTKNRKAQVHYFEDIVL